MPVELAHRDEANRGDIEALVLADCSGDLPTRACRARYWITTS